MELDLPPLRHYFIFYFRAGWLLVCTRQQSLNKIEMNMKVTTSLLETLLKFFISNCVNKTAKSKKNSNHILRKTLLHATVLIMIITTPIISSYDVKNNRTVVRYYSFGLLPKWYEMNFKEKLKKSHWSYLFNVTQIKHLRLRPIAIQAGHNWEDAFNYNTEVLREYLKQNWPSLGLIEFPQWSIVFIKLNLTYHHIPLATNDFCVKSRVLSFTVEI